MAMEPWGAPGRLAVRHKKGVTVYFRPGDPPHSRRRTGEGPDAKRLVGGGVGHSLAAVVAKGQVVGAHFPVGLFSKGGEVTPMGLIQEPGSEPLGVGGEQSGQIHRFITRGGKKVPIDPITQERSAGAAQIPSPRVKQHPPAERVKIPALKPFGLGMNGRGIEEIDGLVWEVRCSFVDGERIRPV